MTNAERMKAVGDSVCKLTLSESQMFAAHLTGQFQEKLNWDHSVNGGEVVEMFSKALTFAERTNRP